jgi:hypothetical protein
VKHYDQKIANEKQSTIMKRCFPILIDKNIAVNAGKIKNEKRTGLAYSIVIATGQPEIAQIVTGDPDFQKLKNVIYIGPETG